MKARVVRRKNREESREFACVARRRELRRGSPGGQNLTTVHRQEGRENEGTSRREEGPWRETLEFPCIHSYQGGKPSRGTEELECDFIGLFSDRKVGRHGA